MIIGYLVADLAYVLTFLLYLGALVLVLEWFFHLLPGPAFNSIRRNLFVITNPFIKGSDPVFLWKIGPVGLRGLWMALLFWIIARFGIPWLVLLSYTLRS